MSHSKTSLRRKRLARLSTEAAMSPQEREVEAHAWLVREAEKDRYEDRRQRGIDETRERFLLSGSPRLQAARFGRSLKGRKVPFRRTDGTSIYFHIEDLTIRFSDHAQPPGGGFAEGKGRIHGEADISCDPATGNTWKDARRMVLEYLSSGFTKNTFMSEAFRRLKKIGVPRYGRKSFASRSRDPMTWEMDREDLLHRIKRREEVVAGAKVPREYWHKVAERGGVYMKNPPRWWHKKQRADHLRFSRETTDPRLSGLYRGAAMAEDAALQWYQARPGYENNPGLAEKSGFTPDLADPEQLAIGTKVEMEHTDDPRLARRIALDHLAEHPDYYRALRKMERRLAGSRRNPPGLVERCMKAMRNYLDNEDYSYVEREADSLMAELGREEVFRLYDLASRMNRSVGERSILESHNVMTVLMEALERDRPGSRDADFREARAQLRSYEKRHAREHPEGPPEDPTDRPWGQDWTPGWDKNPDKSFGTLFHKIYVALCRAERQGMAPGETLPQEDIDDLSRDAKALAEEWLPEYTSRTDKPFWLKRKIDDLLSGKNL